MALLRPGFEVFPLDRESGGKFVAAEFFEQIGAGDEGFDEVETLDTAPGALSGIVGTLFPARALEGNEDRGTAVFLRDPGGDDADDAVVPVLRREDDDGIARKVVLGRDLGICLLDDLVFFLLPLAVDVAQRTGVGRGGRAQPDRADCPLPPCDRHRRQPDRLRRRP